jgi:hypothetical protein
MALSYSAILRVPQAGSFTQITLLDVFEFGLGNTSPLASPVATLTYLKTTYEGLFGGTYSWVITSDATYDIYTISWTGLTTDPITDPTRGNVVALILIDDLSSEQAATQYVYSSICEATGSCTPCPPSVNPDDATDCLSCYPLEIEFCDSTFDIEGLEADTEYTIKITDNVSNKTYDYVAVADQYGIIEITTANYPTGVFTPYNSPLSISILDVNGDPVILTYGYVNYSCLELNVTNTTTIT